MVFLRCVLYVVNSIIIIIIIIIIKLPGRRGFAPDPTAERAPLPRPLAGGEGTHPFPNNINLQASIFGAHHFCGPSQCCRRIDAYDAGPG